MLRPDQPHALRERQREQRGRTEDRSHECFGKDFRNRNVLPLDTETLTDKYGHFWAQPFERGFGTTIGNALRRVLLSSIEGAAVTAVNIEGVLHEFQSIPGVVEDATDIILNLKQIPFKLNGDGRRRFTCAPTSPAWSPRA